MEAATFDGPVGPETSGDDLTLWMAMQREWKDDPKGQVKLVSYKPKSKEWGAVRYPPDKTASGWVGLSEITARGGYVHLIKRDNLVGDAAKLKKLYRVVLSEMSRPRSAANCRSLPS